MHVRSTPLQMAADGQRVHTVLLVAIDAKNRMSNRLHGAEGAVPRDGVSTEASLDALAASLFHRSQWLVDLARQSSISAHLAHRGFQLALELVESLLEVYDRAVGATTSPDADRHDALAQPGINPEVSLDTFTDDRVVTPRRVLIVEDHADAGELLRDLIDAQGHRAVVASTGEEAVEVMPEVRPHLVLCDLGLPGMTGLDVARALRDDPRWAGVRLVALTGYGRPEDKARCLAAGFDEHHTKPISLESLARVLAACGETGAPR